MHTDANTMQKNISTSAATAPASSAPSSPPPLFNYQYSATTTKSTISSQENNLLNQQQIFGVPKGLYYGQYERIDELNDRIYARNIPSNSVPPPLPVFDIRATPTKYSHFPVTNLRKRRQHDLQDQEEQLPTAMPRYIPVDIENDLRNNGVLLQRGTIQNIYIPDSSSDLYKIYVTSRSTQQPFPNLFRRESHITAGEEYISRGVGGGGDAQPFNNMTNARTQIQYIKQ